MKISSLMRRKTKEFLSTFLPTETYFYNDNICRMDCPDITVKKKFNVMKNIIVN